MNVKDYNAMNLVSHVSTIKEINVSIQIVLKYLNNSKPMKITVKEVKTIMGKITIN
jgi:hypothetical protein